MRAPGTKYMLDVAKVLGTDLSKADRRSTRPDGKWKVDLTFTGDGQDRVDRT